MNWGALIISLPFQILIFWCMYKDVTEAYEKKKIIDNKLKNLRSSNNIYIDMSSDEKEMLDALTVYAGFKSNSQFIQSVIKKQDKNILL